MMRTRVIPSLLLMDGGLVKTTRFKDPTYIGDPINAIRIFNDKEVDELVILDIGASREGRGPALESIRDFASECFMPLGYGGGIRSVDDAHAVLSAGVEKVIINKMALRRPQLVADLASRFGSQAIVVSVDVRKKLLLSGWDVVVEGQKAGVGPVEHVRRLVGLGAGEILLNSIDRDGTQQGFDIDLIRTVADAVDVPVIACGGAGSIQHFRTAVVDGHASAVAAGSMFVFHGRHRAVLISYPDREQLEQALP